MHPTSRALQNKEIPAHPNALTVFELPWYQLLLDNIVFLEVFSSVLCLCVETYRCFICFVSVGFGMWKRILDQLIAVCLHWRYDAGWNIFRHLGRSLWTALQSISSAAVAHNYWSFSTFLLNFYTFRHRLCLARSSCNGEFCIK